MLSICLPMEYNCSSKYAETKAFEMLPLHHSQKLVIRKVIDSDYIYKQFISEVKISYAII